MDIPDGFATLAFSLILVLPVAINQAIRRRLVGENYGDREWATTFAQGFVLSAVLLLVYAGAGLVDLRWFFIDAESSPRFVSVTQDTAWFVLVGFVVVPALVSLLIHWRHIAWSAPEPTGWFKWKVVPRSRYGYSNTPTAWDFAVRQHSETGAWLRVLKPEGLWVGGWWGGASFASTYPEPRSVFIHSQWELDDEGNLVREIPNTGVWLMIDDEKDLVFWGAPESISVDEEELVTNE